MLTKSAIAACILAASFTPAFAQDARYLPFTGVWHGEGQAREGANAAWQSAACEITIEWQRGLQSHGVCEGARGRFSAGGTMGIASENTFMVPHFIDVTGADADLIGGAIVAIYEIAEMQFRLTVTTDGRGSMAMVTQVGTDAGWVEVGHLTLRAQ